MGILSRAVGAALRGGAVVVALLATSAAFFLAGSVALVEYYGSAFIIQRPGAVPLRTLRGLDLVAESGRPGRPELLAKKGRIVGGVGCPPNCGTSGKPRGSLRPFRTF